MRAGYEYVGVCVGAMVFNETGQVFLAQRGPAAQNERGCWEFPGGAVAFGERMEDAIRREFMEEYGLAITVERLLHIADHLLPDEGQHWVSSTYLARHLDGTPTIVEPEKCTDLGWFSLTALPEPLSVVTREDVRWYVAEYGDTGTGHRSEQFGTSRQVSIHYRAVAVAVHEGRVLLHRATHERTWSLPGGRVHPFESAAAALRRELREELGVDAVVGRLVWVIKNFYTDAGRRYHEVGLYFAVTFADSDELHARNEPFCGVETVKKLIFHWVPSSRLSDLPINPACLQDRLATLPEQTTHLVWNEALAKHI